MKNPATKNRASRKKSSVSYLKRIAKGSFKSEKDFMELSGLWKGRNISLESIRQVSWR